MAYIGNSPENTVRGRQFVYEFTASAGQTVFSGTDDNGQTLDLLESNQNYVYLNGIRLVETNDYTVSGDTLTLVSGATADDVLVVHTQQEISNFASYTRAEADARYVNFDGDIISGDIQISGALEVDGTTFNVNPVNNTVGIGTDNPNVTLDFGTAATGHVIRVGDENVSAYMTFSNPRGFVGFDAQTGAMVIQSGLTKDIVLRAGDSTWGNGAEVRISDVGNMGIGGAMHPWNTVDNRRALEIGADFGIYNYWTSSSTNVHMLANAYYDGSWKHSSNLAAQNIQIGSGTIRFRRSTSTPSEDAPLTWDDKFYFDLSNTQLGIGTNNPKQALTVAGTGRMNVDAQADYYGAWINGNTAANSPNYFAVGSWYSNATYFQNKSGQSFSHLYTYNPNHNIAIQAGSGDHGDSAESGRVGIGTNTPAAKLEVQLGGEGEYLRVGGDNASNGRALRFTSSSNISNGALHTLNASSGNGAIAFATGSVERLRIDQSGNILHQSSSPEYHFGTSSTSHYNWRVAVQEAVDGGFEIASGTQSAGSAAASDTYTTRLTIKAASGHVGIGTTNPDSLLHVKSSGDTRMTIESPDANDAYINFSGATNEMSLGFDKSANAMFITNHGTITTNRRFTVLTGGNVGIGTDSPAHALDIERSSGNVGIGIQARDNSSLTYINFGDNNDDDVGQIKYDHSNDAMTVTSNGIPRVVVSSAGSIFGGQGNQNYYLPKAYWTDISASGSNTNAWFRVAYLNARGVYEVSCNTTGGWYSPGAVTFHVMRDWNAAALGVVTQSKLFTQYVTQVRMQSDNGGGDWYLEVLFNNVNSNQTAGIFNVLVKPISQQAYAFNGVQVANFGENAANLTNTSVAYNL